MKTFTKLAKNLMAIVGLACVIFGIYLIMSGNITATKRTEDHNITVLYDGEVQSSRSWTNLLGYEFGINLYDSQYIGK